MLSPGYAFVGSKRAKHKGVAFEDEAEDDSVAVSPLLPTPPPRIQISGPASRPRKCSRPINPSNHCNPGCQDFVALTDTRDACPRSRSHIFVAHTSPALILTFRERVRDIASGRKELRRRETLSRLRESRVEIKPRRFSDVNSMGLGRDGAWDSKEPTSGSVFTFSTQYSTK